MPFVPVAGSVVVIPAAASLVQLNAVPDVRDEGVYVNVALLHKSGGVSVLFSAGVGLTVIVKVCGVPEQFWPPLAKVGVTVIVALTGEVPPLVAVKAGNDPVPLAPSPIVVLLFNHA